MRTSSAGLSLIKEFEGLRLAAYQCSARKWTIGYGSTRGVKPGDAITAEQAGERLLFDIREAEGAVQRRVTARLAQHQFDALVAFAFNVGAEAFGRSTLLAKLNQRDYAGAAEEFAKWTHVAGKVVEGLVRRRQAERALFESVTRPAS